MLWYNLKFYTHESERKIYSIHVIGNLATITQLYNARVKCGQEFYEALLVLVMLSLLIK